MTLRNIAAGGRGRVTLLTAVVVAVAVVAPTGELAARSLKRDLRAADQNWKNGKIDQAVAIYETILDAAAASAPERGEALYRMIVVSLVPDSEHHDSSAARALVEQYEAAFPSHPRRLEVAALRVLLEARDAEARKAQELAAQKAAYDEEQQEKLREASTQSESLAAEAESLRQQLAESQKKLAAAAGQLKATKEELARKEEALEKLTRRVVGRAGDG